MLQSYFCNGLIICVTWWDKRKAITITCSLWNHPTESVGITWEGPGKQKKKKKRDSDELNQIFREQNEKMDNMLKEGYSAKDLHSKIYKVKEIINSPKNMQGRWKVKRLSVFVHEEDHKKGANLVPVQLHITSTYMEKRDQHWTWGVLP